MGDYIKRAGLNWIVLLNGWWQNHLHVFPSPQQGTHKIT